MKAGKNVLALIFGLAVALLLAEALFRINGRYYTYSEAQGSGYRTHYAPGKKSWFTTQPPDFEVKVITSDFKYAYRTNSMGFCDREFSRDKREGVKRIIAFGDSFTEGTGAPPDSSWPRQLEDKLNGAGFRCEVWNCGISNSDPVNSWLLLKYRMLEYNPDIALVTVNASDIETMITLKGYERLHHLPLDSAELSPPPPWFEPVYARSHVARHVFHDILNYDWLLQSEEIARQNNKKAILALIACTDSLVRICSGKMKLVFIFHPLNYEVIDNIFKCEEVYRHCTARDYETVNLFEYFRKNGITKSNLYSIYWKSDKHHNARGYSIFADAVAEKIHSLNP